MSNGARCRWGPDAPLAATIATRSGLARIPFDQWLEQAVALDREARLEDAYAIPSIIVADLDRAVDMARLVDQAGLRALELNIGTPYASEAKTGRCHDRVRSCARHGHGRCGGRARCRYRSGSS